jgi:hypothetical protein
LIELYYEGRKGKTKMNAAIGRAKLLELLDLYDYTVIILDALDECDPESQNRLVETLSFLTSASKRPVKLFISSRPDPDIAKSLQEWCSIAVDATQNQPDIDQFVKLEISKHKRWNNMPSVLKDEILQKLSTGSDGMYVSPRVRCKYMLLTNC